MSDIELTVNQKRRKFCNFIRYAIYILDDMDFKKLNNEEDRQRARKWFRQLQLSVENLGKLMKQENKQ